jgi:hypothetical protein
LTFASDLAEKSMRLASTHLTTCTRQQREQAVQAYSSSLRPKFFKTSGVNCYYCFHLVQQGSTVQALL